MLFFLWRMLLGGVVSVVSVRGILKSRIVHKKAFIALIIVACILVITISSMYPVENIFVSFSTPEEAFRYATIGKIESILDGESSSLVVYKTDTHTYSWTVFPKTTNGYKIPTYFTSKRISQKVDVYADFSTYRVSGTQDYYIRATITHGNETIEVYDPSGVTVEATVVKIQGTYWSYIYLQDFSKEHYIVLNGEPVTLG